MQKRKLKDLNLLDVYLEEDLSNTEFPTKATVYDIEPDTKDSEKYISALPKRVRFYHAGTFYGNPYHSKIHNLI